MTSLRTRDWSNGLEHGPRIDVSLYRDRSCANKPRIFGDPQAGIWIARLDASPSGKGWDQHGTLANPFFVSHNKDTRKDFYQVVHRGHPMQTGWRQEILDSSFDPKRLIFHVTHVDTPLGLLAEVRLTGDSSRFQVECLRRGHLFLGAPGMHPLGVVIEEFAVTTILQGGRLLTDHVQPLPFRVSDRILKQSRFYGLPVRYLILRHYALADGQRVVVIQPEFNSSEFDASLYVGTPKRMHCLAKGPVSITGGGEMEFETTEGRFLFRARSATFTPLQLSNPLDVDQPWVFGRPTRLRRLPIATATLADLGLLPGDDKGNSPRPPLI